MLFGILGLVHLALWIWALIDILGSSMTAGNKILWLLVVLLLPVIGLIIYFLIGRGR